MKVSTPNWMNALPATRPLVVSNKTKQGRYGGSESWGMLPIHFFAPVLPSF